MADLFLHNTLTGKRELFKPMTPGKVNFYVCGITPYDESHLGHARCYVVFDMVKRVLQRAGYTVRHVQNYTDVDDKIIDRALKHNVPMAEYIRPFVASYETYMKSLNVLPADEYPRVSAHIPDIITLIEKLVKAGLAYPMDGDVFYSVRKFAPYGALSKRKVDDLESGARVGVDERKKDPLDFALWKAAKPGEPSWDSPWGKGRPGWHIECSAMSMKYLGEEFDIHGGGQDLIFPHHENEIAQSVGATGKPFARVWLHNGFVNVNQEKMSKSLGNFFALKDVLAKHEAMSVRYFLLSQHYRSPLNYSDHELAAAHTGWSQRVLGAHRIATEWLGRCGKPALSAAQARAAEPREFGAALLDDFNTAAALGVLNQTVGDIYELDKQSQAGGVSLDKWPALLGALESMMDTLGLVPPGESWPEDILALVREREAARKSREWKRSDELRDELRRKGVVVEDASTGPRLRRT